MKLEQPVQRLQSLLRAFAFGPELDALAADLLQRLAAHRRRRADISDRTQLKALALIAEYLDAHGRSSQAAALLRDTVEEMLGGRMEEGGDLKLMRQRVWCCLAYALTHLRSNRPQDAGRVILRMLDFVNDKLVQPAFPCHGTVALLRYYEGLWRRNTGQLPAAARAFDAALDLTRLRYEEKKQKYEAVDSDRLRRELVYSRVMTARILGFGHGGIALSRGRFLEARGWMIAASQILANLGQEHWRRALEVYIRSTAVLIAELEPASIPRLQTEGEKLQGLSEWFSPRNARNAFLAAAFALIAGVRVRQIESGQVRRVDLSNLSRRVGQLLRLANVDAGPLSASAALALIDCLLRGGESGRAAKALANFEQTFPGEEGVRAEQQMLEAEIHLESGDLDRAHALLEPLAHQRLPHRGYRARAWALLALCEKRAGRSTWSGRAIAAAHEAAEELQDGFSRAFVREVAGTVEEKTTLWMPMPYQSDTAGDRWCDMDFNLEMARLNVVASVHARHPDYGVEKLAAAMGRGSSWLYALLGRHRNLEWVRELMAVRST